MYLKKNQTTPRPSEHPPVKKNVKTYYCILPVFSAINITYEYEYCMLSTVQSAVKQIDLFDLLID